MCVNLKLDIKNSQENQRSIEEVGNNGLTYFLGVLR